MYQADHRYCFFIYENYNAGTLVPDVLAANMSTVDMQAVNIPIIGKWESLVDNNWLLKDFKKNLKKIEKNGRFCL